MSCFLWCGSGVLGIRFSFTKMSEFISFLEKMRIEILKRSEKNVVFVYIIYLNIDL